MPGEFVRFAAKLATESSQLVQARDAEIRQLWPGERAGGVHVYGGHPRGAASLQVEEIVAHHNGVFRLSIHYPFDETQVLPLFLTGQTCCLHDLMILIV